MHQLVNIADKATDFAGNFDSAVALADRRKKPADPQTQFRRAFDVPRKLNPQFIDPANGVASEC